LIKMVFRCISPEVAVKGFKKSYISNAAVGTDDDLMWDDIEEDGNVRSDREDDDGDSDTDW